MSRENVEIVRQAFEAWNRGDLEWLLDHITPDYEFHTAQLFPDTEAVYRGREGLIQFWNLLREPWETFLVEVERLVPIGEDRVLALLRFHGMGRDGVEVKLEYANLFTIENGMASLNVGFADWQSASKRPDCGSNFRRRPSRLRTWCVQIVAVASREKRAPVRREVTCIGSGRAAEALPQ
jgi:ketosteroid isomerase-like protein